ncbi:MAG: DUF1801 domain-containing protein [Eubacteriales bacterium]
MQYEANSPEEYIAMLPEGRQEAIKKLRNAVIENLPAGFKEVISYGMIGFVVPHSLYQPGYHVKPEEPVPFIGIASQKNHIALYHMGLYLFSDVLSWFESEYPKYVKTKLHMGKSCIRFKNEKYIPYTLIGELCKKITPEAYIEKYKHAVGKISDDNI